MKTQSTLAAALSLALLASVARVASGHHDEPAGDALQGAVFPRLSDSADSIAFSWQGAIWRMPRGGGVMTQLTDEPGFDVEPAWSPDGRHIAFVRGRGSFVGPLRIVRADDGAEVPLEQNIVARDRLFFSGDGRRILGTFRRPGGRVSLCWLDWKTGELGEELQASQWGLRYALSHDRATIVLATTQDEPGEQGGNNGPACDLWTMPAEGGEPTKVVRFPGRVYELSFSGDGQSLYVVSNVGGVHNDIWRVPRHSQQPLAEARKLTFGQADEDRPDASRDGRWLLLTDNQLGSTRLVLRDLQSGVDSVLPATRRQFKRPAGELHLKLLDDGGQQPVTARVSVRQLGGKHYAPPGRLYRMLRDEMHFYCDGSAQLQLPAGRYLVKAARGTEYRIARQEVEVSEGRPTEATVQMERWIHQRLAGWHSGESHIHANYGYGQWYNSPRTMKLQCAGEDLNVANFMVANSEADGVFDREFFRGRPDPLSTNRNVLYWNEEFRSTIWGHMTLLNLKQLVEPIFTGFADTTHPHDHPTNADVADLTHDQDGHVNYTHPAHNEKDPYLSAYSAKALPLDVALGKVDSIDVMGSNHVATMPLWYRLLNCGMRIPASAGTDCFLNRIVSKLPGQDRVYVHVEDEFTYQAWIDGLKAGRTFVTNGPMLEFTVDQLPAGDVRRLPGPGKVRVQGRVRSQYPLNRIEIICNSEVAATIQFEAPGLEVVVDESISIERSGWVALRAGGPPQAEQPDGSVFAHTSPVYLHVEGRPVDARADAQYFVDWISRLRTNIRRRNRIPSRHQVHVESQMAEAQKVFNRLLRE